MNTDNLTYLSRQMSIGRHLYLSKELCVIFRNVSSTPSPRKTETASNFSTEEPLKKQEQ
jgi:hypothetical protein